MCGFGAGVAVCMHVCMYVCMYNVQLQLQQHNYPLYSMCSVLLPAPWRSLVPCKYTRRAGSTGSCYLPRTGQPARRAYNTVPRALIGDGRTYIIVSVGNDGGAWLFFWRGG